MFDYFSERTVNELKLILILLAVFSASMFLINVQIGLGHLLVISYMVIFYLIKERRKLQNKLNSVSYDTEKIVSLIRHEVRSPLSAIVGYSGMIKDIAQQEHSKSLEFSKYLSRIESSAERIDLIIKQLVLSENQEDCLLDVVDLKRMVNESFDFFEERCRLNNIQFCTEYKSKASIIKGCEIQISQVLTNLLNNAFDAVNEHEGQRWIKLEISDTCSKQLLISISDSGPGIPVDLQDKIMNSFFTTKAKNGGMGIGLSLSKQIIERHKGSLRLNQLAKNTQFEILLPRW